MKKIMIILICTILVLSSCQNKASENAPDAPAQGSGNVAENNIGEEMKKGDAISLYDRDGLSFDVPEIWQRNFKAVTRNVGSNGNTYPQTDFYYTDGERDIRLMSIGKFTREQWDGLKNSEGSVDDILLGESPDKNHIYSIFYENHDYITDDALKKIISEIKAEAEKLKGKITIR